MDIKSVYAQLQTDLKAAGLYTGTVDGAWGPISHGAFVNARRIVDKGTLTPFLTKFAKATAWSAKVSDVFISKARDIAAKLGVSADDLMSCMAFESGETFSPSIKNGAGAPYYGLIQFGKEAAADCGTTVEALVKMTAEQQIDYVYLYFKPLTGKLRNLGDLYMKILWPAGVGKDDSYVLWDANTRPTTYAQNKGLDINGDRVITRGECIAKVNDKLVRGLNPVNLKVV